MRETACTVFNKMLACTKLRVVCCPVHVLPTPTVLPYKSSKFSNWNASVIQTAQSTTVGSAVRTAGLRGYLFHAFHTHEELELTQNVWQQRWACCSYPDNFRTSLLVLLVFVASGVLEHPVKTRFAPTPTCSSCLRRCSLFVLDRHCCQYAYRTQTLCSSAIFSHPMSPCPDNHPLALAQPALYSPLLVWRSRRVFFEIAKLKIVQRSKEI